MTPPELDYKLLLKRSLLAIDDLKAKVAAHERAVGEPIAIVGAGCRLPGGADTPEGFWELLASGTDAVTEVPPERWDVEAYYDPDPDVPGKAYSRWGAFLKNVDMFDADFFGVSPREAVGIDPQQRLLLEVAWEAMEHSGIAPSKLAGTRTAVYLGISTHDYAHQLIKSGGIGYADAYAVSGSTHSMASGRMAYVFGFHGPNLATDTACSSSTVATHLAVQSLRNGEADVALAAGVNLTLSPDGAILTSRARMASPTGRCHTFDASADGYVRGEGCIVLVLKRLSDAQRDGDRVLALIRGSAINQDGRSSGLTAPFGPAQESVIRAALANAGLSASDVSYVEAHGTGTSLGDPIEIKALGETYGKARSADAPLKVGSVKTNVGHLEGAAGAAGMLKVIMALRNRAVPPHLHFTDPNPLIPWDQYPVTVPTTLTAWTTPDGVPRRAGASSFGFSGTNGHVILEEAPDSPRIAPIVDRPRHVLPLSAQTPDTLTALAGRYAEYFARPDAAPLSDVTSTASIGRSHFVERLAIVASSNEEARTKLLAVVAGQSGPGIARGRAEGSTTPEVVFMCTGQGAQYPGMARQLYDAQPTFKRILDQCAAILDPELDHPLLSVIFPADPNDIRVNDTEYTQPALFAVEYALANLWRSWGIEPSVVMGHSVGEYVAACLAGVFTLEDGLRLIAARGRLMGKLPRSGAMAAIFADEARVRIAIASVQDRVSVAGVNGPENTVISGDAAAVDAIVNQFTGEGVECQRLTVSHAFHSPAMDSILDAFEAVAATVTFSAPTIGIVSNVTGTMAGDEIRTPGYWRRHLRDAVRFSDSIATVHQDGYRIFLEIGPHATLLGMARRCLPGDGPVWLPSLRKGVDDWTSMLDTLASLYVHGFPVDWSGVDQDYRAGRQRATLPNYPFARRRFWLTLNAGPARHSALIPMAHLHPLLDGKLPTASAIYETSLNLAGTPYLIDHQIANLVLFPATGFLELALAAARETLGTNSVAIQEFAIGEALIMPAQDDVRLQIVFTPVRDGSTRFHIYSARPGDDPAAPPLWHPHVSGVAAIVVHDDAPVAILDHLQAQCPDPLDVAQYYETLESVGADYGPAFRGITQLQRGHRQSLAHVQLPDLPGIDTKGYIFHPALFDACAQTIGTALPGFEADSTGHDLYVPIGIADIKIYAPAGTDVWCHVVRADTDPSGETAKTNLTILTPAGDVVAEIQGFELKKTAWTTMQRRLRSQSLADWIYNISWQSTTDVVHVISGAAKRLVIVGDGSSLETALATQLRASKHEVTLVTLDHATIDIDTIRAQLTTTLASGADGLIHLIASESRLAPQTLNELEATEQQLLSQATAVAQACAEAEVRLWLVTRGSQPVAGSVPDVVQAPAWGFAGVVASEYPALACTRIDLDPTVRTNSISEEVVQLVTELSGASDEGQIAFRSETRYAARMVPAIMEAPAVEPVRLEITQRGQLDQLTIAPMTRRAPGAGEVELRVYATGLNFRDVLNALGAYPGDPGPLGNECAGVITAVGAGVTDLAIGDEVITMIDQSFASYAIAPAALTVPKPKRLSFAEAATIPVTFLTADYALNQLGRMKAGDRVLIHAATGGVGMAALQLARRAGAEIFGTAGSPAKRAMAAELGAHHLADSRSVSFADEFERITNGSGVDIALNSLAGDFIPRTLELLRPGGRFIEIGKTDVWDATRVETEYPGLEYHVLYLGSITESDPAGIRQRLLTLLADFESGELQPLPIHAFPLSKAIDAFRFMAQAKHTGKIVLTQQHEPLVTDRGTYLVTGGLGGLGLTVAQWLAAEGARHLVLMGRRAPSSDAAAIIQALTEQGVHVTIAQGDVASSSDVARIVNAIQASDAPLRGIMHAAGVVDDAMVPDQTWSRLERVLAPKVAGSWNLHTATTGIPLDFFVMFSSGAAILGSPGQSNYAAANLFLDALAHLRQARGLPALSINWGSWSGVGMAAEVGESHRRRWAALGLGMIAPEDGVQIMRELMMGATTPQAAVLPLTVSKLRNTSPFFSELVRLANAVGPSTPALNAPSMADQQLHRRVSETEGSERVDLVVAFLRDQLVRVLALDPSYQVDPHRSIMEMGLDSLMAMELRNRINTLLKVTVSVGDLLLGPSVYQLTDAILSKFVTVDGGGSRDALSLDDAALLANVDTLSDEDLDAQLERLLADAPVGEE